MKILLSKLKINKFSPLQIGFIASFALHSALFAFALDFNNSAPEKSMKSQSISISLANIAGQNIHAQKSHKKHKKKLEKKPQKKREVRESTKKQEQIAESSTKQAQIAESSTKFAESNLDSAMDSAQDSANNEDLALDSAMDSALDSTLGASVNEGESVEILGSDDALYASILDIINSNRIYPRIAIIRRLQDNIKVEFILDKSGEVQALRVLNGKHRILNDNALDTIMRASKSFPKLERSKKIRMIIAYDLM